MLYYFLGAIALLVVLLLVVIWLRSSEIMVTRKGTMTAPPSAPFAEVNDFRRWRGWSPWENLDPNLNRAYEGPPAGVGSSYHWSGNKKVGEGKMTITESRPGERIRIRLEFIKPFPAVNEALFAFRAMGNQTEVTWTMNGKCNFMMKAMGLFMSMDQMLGRSFEQGLTQLKAVSEGQKA